MNQTAKRRLAALEAENAGFDKDPSLMSLDELLAHAVQLCVAGGSQHRLPELLQHASDRDLAAMLAEVRRVKETPSSETGLEVAA